MDRLTAMAVFVRVVERGSFSAVARELGQSQPNVSKQIRALEAQLGGRLIARSTRHLSLTDEGQRYYADCRNILAAVDTAERSFQSGREQVAGPLRVASSVSFGRRQLAPRVPGFLERYPGVTLDLLLSDRNEDLIGEGVDVALRIGTLRDSGLLGRRLGNIHRWTVAAPGYLARHGAPRRVEDLRGHNCLIFTLLADGQTWTYRRGRMRLSVTVAGNVRSNNSEAIRELVLAGHGIALVPAFLYAEDVRAKRVVALLAEYRAEALPLHAVSPANRRQSARVRAFVDHVAEVLAGDPLFAASER